MNPLKFSDIYLHLLQFGFLNQKKGSIAEFNESEYKLIEVQYIHIFLFLWTQWYFLKW